MMRTVLQITSNSAVFKTKQTLPPLIVGISSCTQNPQITSDSDLLNLKYSTYVNLPWKFDVLSCFALDRLTVAEYEENIHKMQKHFPIVNPLGPYGMRRTSSATIDKLPESRKCFFIETAYGDSSMFLLISKEIGKIVGIKFSGQLCLLEEYAFLKSDKLAEAAGVSDRQISTRALKIPRVSWLGVTSLNLKNAFAALRRLFQTSKVDNYQMESFFLLNSVAWWGVKFPRVYDEVFETLKSNYRGDGLLSASAVSTVEAWERCSIWWFSNGGKQFTLNDKNYDAYGVSMLVSVVDAKCLSPQGNMECQKDLQNFQTKEWNAFQRDISKYNREKVDAALAAWNACRDGCDHDSYFREIKFKNKETLVVAKEAWKRAYKAYFE